MHKMNRLLLFFFLTLTFLYCKPTSKVNISTTLENTKWKLSEMNGIPIITPENTEDVHFVLTAEKGEYKIQGFAGCNRIMGGYERTGDHIKFMLASTMMMCQGEQMEIEDFFTRALTATDSYKLDGEILTLFERDTSLAVFKAIKIE